MIENMITELTMLGTGNATVTKCYNTCFTIKIGKNILLVDAGGGNGILRQLEKAGIAISEIHDMFVTHAHTDHILGAVWMVRIVMQKMLSGQYTGTFRVYGHDKVLEVLDWICRKLLPAKIVALIGSAVEFREVKDGEMFRYRIHQRKTVRISNAAAGRTVVCLSGRRTL